MAVAPLAKLDPQLLWVKGNTNAASGDGGVCLGDSGGPDFLGTGPTIVGVHSFLQYPCHNLGASVRLDTAVARASSWHLSCPCPEDWAYRFKRSEVGLKWSLRPCDQATRQTEQGDRHDVTLDNSSCTRHPRKHATVHSFAAGSRRGPRHAWMLLRRARFLKRTGKRNDHRARVV